MDRRSSPRATATSRHRESRCERRQTWRRSVRPRWRCAGFSSTPPSTGSWRPLPLSRSGTRCGSAPIGESGSHTFRRRSHAPDSRHHPRPLPGHRQDRRRRGEVWRAHEAQLGSSCSSGRLAPRSRKSAISEFPKGRKYLISLSFRGKASVRPAQVGGFDVNIVIHGSTAVRGRGDLVAYRWALWKLTAPWTHRTRPPHLGKRCAFSTSSTGPFPSNHSRKTPKGPKIALGNPDRPRKSQIPSKTGLSASQERRAGRKRGRGAE